jgi:hypothetical protein
MTEAVVVSAPPGRFPESLDDQLTELKRELAMRNQLYPAWIKRGSMDPSVALRRTRRLQAAIETIEQVKASLAKTGV